MCLYHILNHMYHVCVTLYTCVCTVLCSFLGFFLRSTFVGPDWSFGFFIPATTANDLQLRRIFYLRFYPLHLIRYLNSSERASISLLMLSAKEGNYWYHFITSLV